MAGWSVNEDNRLRLHLSAYASNIMDQDFSAFRADSKTNFYNTVFTRFYEAAESSIARRSDKAYSFLKELFKNLIPDDEQDKQYDFVVNLLDDVTTRLLDVYEQHLKDKHTKKEFSYKPRTHRITNDLKGLITGIDVKMELKHYVLSQYFTAVIEEYCHKPSAEREKIYLVDLFEKIQIGIYN